MFSLTLLSDVYEQKVFNITNLDEVWPISNISGQKRLVIKHVL